MSNRPKIEKFQASAAMNADTYLLTVVAQDSTGRLWLLVTNQPGCETPLAWAPLPELPEENAE